MIIAGSAGVHTDHVGDGLILGNFRDDLAALAVTSSLPSSAESSGSGLVLLEDVERACDVDMLGHFQRHGGVANDNWACSNGQSKKSRQQRRSEQHAG